MISSTEMNHNILAPDPKIRYMADIENKFVAFINT